MTAPICLLRHLFGRGLESTRQRSQDGRGERLSPFSGSRSQRPGAMALEGVRGGGTEGVRRKTVQDQKGLGEAPVLPASCCSWGGDRWTRRRGSRRGPEFSLRLVECKVPSMLPMGEGGQLDTDSGRPPPGEAPASRWSLRRVRGGGPVGKRRGREQCPGAALTSHGGIACLGREVAVGVRRWPEVEEPESRHVPWRW